MIILASASPRRQELLRLVTEEFAVDVADVDETIEEGTPPEQAVVELARRKAEAVAKRRPGDLVIGADTVVALKDAILGKPRDAEDAFAMLRSLSGRAHHVYTGVAVAKGQGCRTFAEKTRVDFLPLDNERIRRYVATGEPFDKAGAYGIQGAAALFITGIAGDYYNVMGLPVCRLANLLSEVHGIETKL